MFTKKNSYNPRDKYFKIHRTPILTPTSRYRDKHKAEHNLIDKNSIYESFFFRITHRPIGFKDLYATDIR